MKSSSCLYLVAYAFSVISKKPLLIQGHEDFPSVFSSKSSMVLALLFGFWNHLEDLSGGEGVHLHSLAEGYGVVLAPFVEKKLFFSPMNYLATRVENQLNIDTGVYFWILNLFPWSRCLFLCQCTET